MRSALHSSSSATEVALDKAAALIASGEIKNDDLLGLGSGSSVARFARALGKRVSEGSVRVRVFPSSTQSWWLAKESGLELEADTSHCPPDIDVCVDGADQVRLSDRSMIKGGGGALLREKIILSSARRAYILGERSKFVESLNLWVPVEVVPFALLTTERRLKNDVSANPLLRKLDKGYPYFTESGNLIYDCSFAAPIQDSNAMENSLKSIPGVVECGIFTCKVDRFYAANQDGSVDEI